MRSPKPLASSLSRLFFAAVCAYALVFGGQMLVSPQADAAVQCRTASGGYTQKTVTGATAYRFTHTASFCFDGRRVTRVYNQSIGINSIDANFYWRGIVNQTHGINGNGSGWSFRKGQLDNCVLKYGCIGTGYPWVTLNFKGNGAWSVSSGPR
ncbi:hypothetical protein GORBP_065_01940 [Gordonia rubripertincta NBRC 101908]|uniref:Secreted protein n=1 Tax=Gordonia rubripertincta NBRC 101908 TaxID=1077975 RepID=A0ABQ0HUB5_GORRU|nr:hypothetical protein GCWB2_17100 [Gordonia rubripertincta]GAB85864.1 hypothetical protein GORBP_065_01940 [Gordonia rubripertincta NBRC 101908]